MVFPSEVLSQLFSNEMERSIKSYYGYIHEYKGVFMLFFLI